MAEGWPTAFGSLEWTPTCHQLVPGQARFLRRETEREVIYLDLQIRELRTSDICE